MTRTDLALEEHGRLTRKNEHLEGVKVDTWRDKTGIEIHSVIIETENAAKRMGKPKGEYVTIEFSRVHEKEEICKKQVMEQLAEQLKRMLPAKSEADTFTIGRQGAVDFSVLVVGLGNRNVEMDALGPITVDKIHMSRHIMKEFGRYAYGSEEVCRVSGIAPGTMEETGLEAYEIVKGIIRETLPDVVITIDALVGKNSRRLGRTIQLTNTGVVPGSGVGMHRKSISKDNMGVPVISIGVPTVVDASYGLFLIPQKLPTMIDQLSDIIALGIQHALQGI